jgi:hypothetical protein
MDLISAWFISLLLTALAAGVVLGHVMSRAGKITLPGPLFVTVQNTLYRNWGKASELSRLERFFRRWWLPSLLAEGA